MNDLLHVANGTSTTMTIEAARIPGAVSIWADPLHDGPVPGNLTDAALLEVRARYLAGQDDAAETIQGLKAWRDVIARHDTYRELVLWYEHDLFDQLNLIQLLTWIRGAVPPAKTVSLVCIDSFPGRPNFKGLGELTTGELKPLLETRQVVTSEQYAVAERAWRAFREATPQPLDDLRQTDTSALPFLGASLTRFLQEYPWTTDGLSRRERRLLELSRDGAVPLSSVFPKMDRGETAYYISDTSLADTASALAATSPPLLTVSDGEGFRREVSITDAGRAVLAGKADRVALCGIDRWFGGVHLHGGNLWRWDDESQRIRAA